MNTKRLAKSYELLLPEERVALMSTAKSRRDELEINRLLNSAPSVNYRLPNFFGVADTLVTMSFFQLCDLLDLSLHYHRCLGRVESWAFLDNEELVDRMYQTAQVFGYLFLTKLDAWRRFLDNHQIDQEEPWRGLPGYKSIIHTEDMIRDTVISKVEVEAILHQKDSSAQTYSVDYCLEALERCFSEGVARWK